MFKDDIEDDFEGELEDLYGGNWTCTATASPSGSDPLDQVLSFE